MSERRWNSGDLNGYSIVTEDSPLDDFNESEEREPTDEELLEIAQQEDPVSGS